MIYIFAGGLAVGTLINESGAAERIGELVSGMGLTGWSYNSICNYNSNFTYV